MHQRAMSRLWSNLDGMPGWLAPAVTWRALLGDEWTVAQKAPIWRRPGRAASLPCPRGGEPHAVITHAEDDIVAVPDGESCTCDDQAVTADQVAMWAVSPAKLGRALAKALELQPREGDIGIDGVHEVGAFSGHAVPVFLILARDVEAFRAAVSELVARQEAFGLIAPTSRHLDARCRDLLGRRRTVFVSLETNIEITADGTLRAKTAPGELLKGLLPAGNDEIHRSEAAKVLAILGKLRSERGKQKRKKAPLFDVFMLLVVDGLSQKVVARECGCTPGLVSLRVKELEQRFSVMKVAELKQFTQDVNESDVIKGDRWRRKNEGARPDAFEGSDDYDNESDNGDREDRFEE